MKNNEMRRKTRRKTVGEVECNKGISKRKRREGKEGETDRGNIQTERIERNRKG